MSLRRHVEQLKKSAVDAVSHNIKKRKWETYKQFSHKHLESTAAYLRFVMDDVKPNHRRLVDRMMPQKQKEETIKK